ncbi:MAG: lasso RiPP family leader peptide-containing protein [Nitrospiraceae bacterium]|nr:MAG: lasso RiPP family leader peptide-containing protein [Nitrospiraceae bacterium]
MEQDKPQAPLDMTAKKPYVTPCLVEYGSVAKLTQGGAGSVTDGGMMGAGMRSAMMMCL